MPTIEERVAALEAAMTPSNAALAARMSEYYDDAELLLAQLRDAIVGTAAGGPEPTTRPGDYPVDDPKTDARYWVPSFLKMAMLAKDLNIGFLNGAAHQIGADQDKRWLFVTNGETNTSLISVTLQRTAAVRQAHTFVQAGAGRLNFFTSGSGTTKLRHDQAFTRSARRWCVVTAICFANPTGNDAEWLLVGGLAA